MAMACNDATNIGSAGRHRHLYGTHAHYWLSGQRAIIRRDGGPIFHSMARMASKRALKTRYFIAARLILQTIVNEVVNIVDSRKAME